MTNTAATFDADAWQRLGRVTGVAGLAAVILILVPIVVGTRPEPAFTATATSSSPTTGHQTQLRPSSGLSSSPLGWSPSFGSSAH
jgi:hypothetical protein